MKIKNGFVLRHVADENVIVATGEATKIFNGIVNVNATGAFIFNLLEKETTLDKIASAVASEYGIDEETAKADALKFISGLKEANCIDE